MFTGIVQHLGRVLSLESRPSGVRLIIDASGWSHRPSRGDSIAVDGCCLTVAEQPGGERSPANPVGGSAGGPDLAFDVIRQTLDVTTLGALRAGDRVNLEHAVTPQTLLGGHVVQGHVDHVGLVSHVAADASQHRVRITPPPAAMDCIVERGSIAVQGVSLTIASVVDDSFEVALIPTTLELTNLGKHKPGDRVNLETDYIAKTVVNWLRRRAE